MPDSCLDAPTVLALNGLVLQSWVLTSFSCGGASQLVADMRCVIGAFRGGMPFGSVLSGWLIPLWTAPTVLALNGLVLLVLGLYFLFVQRRVAAL